MKVRHILLTSDLSTESIVACIPVGTLARALKARITLLHVIQEPQMASYGLGPVSPPATAVAGRQATEVEQALEQQAKLLGPGLEVSCAAVPGLRVHDAVLDYARRHAVDLIALATHGRSGFRRFALGSVAETILRHSDVPVLVYPHRE